MRTQHHLDRTCDPLQIGGADCGIMDLDSVVMSVTFTETGERFHMTARGAILDAVGDLVDMDARSDVRETFAPNAEIVHFHARPGSSLLWAGMGAGR